MTGNHKNHTASVAGKNGFSLISDDTFRELYAALLQCVMLDEIAMKRAKYERWNGREAATAGISVCLRRGDTITATPRSVLARYLQHKSLIGLDAAVDDPLAAATSDGLRHKLTAQGNVAVVFSQIGNPEQAHRSFMVAAKQALPVLYVLEGGSPLNDAAGNIPVMRVDEDDTVAVYRVAHESIARGREGGGPTVVECASWTENCGSSPLERLETYLSGKKLFRQDWKRRLERNYAITVRKAVACESESPHADPMTFPPDRASNPSYTPAFKML